MKFNRIDLPSPSPLPQAGEGAAAADKPFSRLREKVAGDSRPDEGLRRDTVSKRERPWELA